PFQIPLAEKSKQMGTDDSQDCPVRRDDLETVSEHASRSQMMMLTSSKGRILLKNAQKASVTAVTARKITSRRSRFGFPIRSAIHTCACGRARRTKPKRTNVTERPAVQTPTSVSHPLNHESSNLRLDDASRK
ncbi:unnamed protein product, partial [Mycena citricolor]